ncbi:malonate decarboxylase subunit epsilon [Pseudomonas cremoricolorata]|uniref:Malonyl CoA-acyl carrier protein transacylase n=1 Tax=Pseudomonas cremoricolorata TaxID=157783 RepID=A0A089WGN7_9PSED|nr:malonate decarboxylase subunit epsilon [Pseudomonas cremoricolorata]AIR87741.1 malonate decarboxylase subunit epsilon [Pseudomonas cremoricolorata]
MSILFAFPGQGAQYPGMLQALDATPVVKECLEQAGDVLGQSLASLDTPEALTDTRAVQLCLLIAGTAQARLLLQDNPPPDYVSGLSIGAYPAAVIAGALDYADALRLVALRGTLMQQAYPRGYGMTAILGLERSAVERLIAQATLPVFLANINADNQHVIAGSDAAMAAFASAARAAGAGAAKRLAVSVPSHCALLEAPAQALAEAFAEVTLRRPRIGYLSSTRARPLHDPEVLRDDLAFNMCRPVEWYATLRNAHERGVRLLLELPPGSVLSGLARRVFDNGTAVACQGTRPDTLAALIRREVNATH